MVNLTELTVHQAQSNNRPNSKRNAKRSSNGVVAIRSKPRKSRIVLGREFNSMEHEDEFQAAHRFKNGHLIMTLVAWAKKPSVEHDLSGVLLKYRRNITGNRNLIESALILQAAANLYARKVDLLFKSTMESQLRIVKSFNIINAEELHKIEKKMRKRKLTQIDDRQRRIKRHKRHNKWLNRPIFGEIFNTMTRICKEGPSSGAKEPFVHEIDPQSLKAMEIALTAAAKLGDPAFVKADMEQFKKDYEARFVPLEQYIYRPFVEKSQFVAYESPDKEQVVQWESLLMSDHDVYHEKKFKWYEVFYNKKDPVTMMDITVWEDALYDHRKANLDAVDFCDLLDNYDKFNDIACEKFLMGHLKEEYDAQMAAETLKEKNKRLCPYQLDVHVNRLSDDIMQRYLNNTQIVENSQQNASPSQLNPPQNEESDENITVLVVSDPENPSEDPEILVLPQTSVETNGNVSDLSERNNTSHCTENSGLDNDSGFASGSEPNREDLLADASENNNMIEEVESSDLTPKETVECGKETNKSTIKLRARKLVKADTDDEGDEIEKSPKKKKRFKPDITTTTCNLLDYERFFCENYKADEREGVVVPLPPPAVPEEPEHVDDLPDQDLHTEDTTVEPLEEEYQSQTPRIPRLPTGEIITKEIRRFMAIQAEIAENREEQRWYYDWESMIKDRLKEQLCSKFDIHEYGAKIVNLFPENEPGKSLSFKDIVKDQPKREVVRNFIAALHLATSMNLQVSGTSAGVLCNETLQFKLLSRELHHETLLGYEAPSELKLGEKNRKNTSRRRLNEAPTSVIQDVSERNLEKKQKTSSTGRNTKSSKNRGYQKIKKPIVLNNFISSAHLSDSLAEVQDRLSTGRNNESRSSAQQSNNQISNINPKVVLERISFEQIPTNNKHQQQNIAQISPPSKSSSEVRCTTTIVKTPENLSFCTPAATSTPLPRSSYRKSCDSGFCTDGSVTPGTSPPNFAKVRRLTIEDSLLRFDGFDITAGPSTDYTLNYPAALDDVNTSLCRQIYVGGDRERVICSRKRQLDFGTGDKVIGLNNGNLQLEGVHLSKRQVLYT